MWFLWSCPGATGTLHMLHSFQPSKKHGLCMHVADTKLVSVNAIPSFTLIIKKACLGSFPIAVVWYHVNAEVYTFALTRNRNRFQSTPEDLDRKHHPSPEFQSMFVFNMFRHSKKFMKQEHG
jgi:hypothetical protein